MKKDKKILLKCFAKSILTLIIAFITFALLKFEAFLIMNYFVWGIGFFVVSLILFLMFLFWLEEQ